MAQKLEKSQGFIELIEKWDEKSHLQKNDKNDGKLTIKGLKTVPYFCRDHYNGLTVQILGPYDLFLLSYLIFCHFKKKSDFAVRQ